MRPRIYRDQNSYSSVHHKVAADAKNTVSKAEQLEQHVLSQSGARVRLSFDDKGCALVLADSYVDFLLTRQLLRERGVKEVQRG